MLEQVEWGEFRLGNLFDSSNGDFDIQKNHINGLGEYVITAGLTDNGILGKTDIPAKIFDKGTITIDMFGYAFYRQFKYKLVTHARVFSLKPKFKITDREGLFISSLFHFLDKEFGYDDMCSWAKIEDKLIKFPINKDGEINFAFMDKFISELEAEHQAELEAYLETTGLKNYELTSDELKLLKEFEEEKIEWKNFKIGGKDGLFSVATGRDVIIGRTIEGNIPLISHQHENNGISKRISKLEDRRLFNYKATLSLADRGVFLATTQNEDFHIGTRVKALTFKTGEQSVNNRLFFVSAINMLQILFTEYADNATDSLPDLEIQLPVKNDLPNYEFMEKFISAIEKLVIKDVVVYNQERLKATAEIVSK